MPGLQLIKSKLLEKRDERTNRWKHTVPYPAWQTPRTTFHAYSIQHKMAAGELTD